MVEALLLLGGSVLGVGAYYKNKHPKKRSLHALMKNGSPQLLLADESQKKEVDASQITPVKEQSPEEKKAIRVFSANTGAIILLLSSRAYPIVTLPGIVLALYACIPIYRRMFSAVIAIFKEKKLKKNDDTFKSNLEFELSLLDHKEIVHLEEEFQDYKELYPHEK